MKRTVLGVALLTLVTACGVGEAGTPAPGDDIPVRVLAFEPGGWAPKRLAAVSDTPIRLDAFAGWYGGAESLDELPDPQPDEPDTTYVAATDATHCRAPEQVRVSRAGADLRVEFIGGTDHETCVRAVGPIAYLALPTREVRGVRTVNGAAPVDAAGPGRLTDFVPLGTVGFGRNAAAELGDTGALRTRLAATGVAIAGDVAAALNRPVPAGERGFAFVLTGCEEKSAVLLVSPDRITADLVRDEAVGCAAPVYFLVTFTAAAADLPEHATPR
jgi:hypothetical protein